MDKKEATKLISEKITEAYTLIKEAEDISDESGVDFSWDLAYGMGGHYYPNGWNSSDCYGESVGWNASSQSC